MKENHSARLALSALITAMLAGCADPNTDELNITGPVTVTPETYIRAETDRAFTGSIMQSGGVNIFKHDRTPPPVDQQPIVRMNKDTLYSGAIVDTEGGATLTVPEIAGGRYVSALLIDNDHYVPSVIYGAGIHKLPQDSKYLGVIIRVQLFDANDPTEIKLVNTLQDQIVITANSADPFPPFKWDIASLKTLTEQYEKEASQARLPCATDRSRPAAMFTAGWT
jgi:hypothetical protein